MCSKFVVIEWIYGYIITSKEVITWGGWYERPLPCVRVTENKNEMSRGYQEKLK